MSANPIRIWNREASREEVEQVYGEGAVAWMYGTPLGRRLSEGFVTGKTASALYGWYQSTSLSRRKILPFVDLFKIPMEEYEDRQFGSFNEFFIRKFRPGSRVFENDPSRMPAFSEARYFAYASVRPETRIPVKGEWLSAGALLGGDKSAKAFEGGPLLLARLCPTDYHRFHFPDDGSVDRSWRIHGRLHSVNPMALRYRGDIFATNERQVTLLETEHFGKLAYIEVGAVCVGKIVQTFSGEKFHRGDEKGYFLFGASTVIVLGEPGRWTPDPDLLALTERGMEAYVKLGSAVARRL